MSLYRFKGNQPIVHPSAFIAPTAQIIGNVHIGKLSSIWFNTVIRGDMDEIRIGEETNIQDLSMCHADENVPLAIGSRVTIGHGGTVHGCTIEDECLIGMGSIVLNHAVIGTGSIIAAGAVVLEKTEIPPFSLVTGSPGKIKKTYENRSAIQEIIQYMSREYLEHAAHYQNDTTFFKVDE